MNRSQLDRSCLLIVDIMNDFVFDEGAYIKHGLMVFPESERQTLIGNNRKLIDAMRALGRPIVYIRGEHRNDDLDDMSAFPNKMKCPTVGFKEIGSWGAQVIDAIKPQPDDIVILKKGHSGFGFTELGVILTRLGIDLVVATGGGSVGCLSDTVREGAGWGFDFVIVRDACYNADSPALPVLANHCGELIETAQALALMSRLRGVEA